MYIQFCVKGIRGATTPDSVNGMSKNDAFDLVRSGGGIISNWWRHKKKIYSHEPALVLNDHNLDRHLHDYDNFGAHSPFISLASGCTERNVLLQRNKVHSAVDTALQFATDYWAYPGALFFCWTPVGLNPAVEISSVAEPVRDLNVYHRWSPYQLEGEIAAKVQIPSNQISRVEWWDGSQRKDRPVDTFFNSQFVDPKPITNIRELF
jgi:hypothetical protein